MRIIFLIKTAIGENRTWLKKILSLFATFIILGAVAFYFYPGLIHDIVAVFEQKFGANPELDTKLALEIFRQNAIVLAIAVFGGILLGLPTLVLVVTNGFLIGFIITSVLSLPGQSMFDTLLFLLLGLLPHGILEIPAFLFGATAGLRLGWHWIGQTKGERFVCFKKDMAYASRAFLVLFLIIFVAAFLEVFVSGYFVG